ncbi:hypothetical protein H9L21_07595 [Aeromicrobium senzhongii]|uniref:SCP domain-containing protein n=1 Tax=Aeromicrobium senzhongii TaxID=2663859 RepID=A0ABX6SXD6_9ACTN|nr:hypothetical protein [Aeromicrobium senzhongii]QNL95751.1 hypothetical protein H9L21_07595 [Aeromicrobium senzhongii]
MKFVVVMATVLAMVVATAGASNAVKWRKVSQVSSIAKTVEKSFVSQNRTKGKETANSCLRKQARYEANRSAKRGKNFYKVNRKTVAKKCGLAHVHMVFVKQSSKSTKSRVVKRVRRTHEYKKSIRSAKHKVYGAATYRDKKKGRTYTVLFVGQKKPVVKKPAPAPKPTPTTVPTAPAPTTVPTTPAPTTVPTTAPTTPAPTTAPTTVPTTVPTPTPPPPPVPADPNVLLGVKDWLRHELTIPGPSGWVDGDSCVAGLANQWAKNIATTRTLTGVPADVTTCDPYNESLVLSAATDAWPMNPPLDIATELLNGVTGPTTTGPRTIADALAASSGRVALSVYRNHDGSLWAVAVVTFEHPRYTTPVRTDAFDKQVTDAVAAKTTPTGANVQTADACITTEIDARAKTMATGQTNPDERQWTTKPLDCPNLYKQFFTYSNAKTPEQIAADLTTGVLRGDSGTTAKDRINYALTHDEGRIVTRSYRDYRGNVWTYAGVILDDMPYKAPVEVTNLAADVRAKILARSSTFIDTRREEGFWTEGDPVWTEADACLQDAVERWAKSKAEDRTKNKSIYNFYAASPSRDNTMWGGKYEAFANSGCEEGYEEGFVLASKGGTADAIVNELFNEPVLETRTEGGITSKYAKNWAAEGAVATHLARGYTATFRSYRDFRGDVWTYIAFAGKPGDTNRLDRNQITEMEDATIAAVNDYRASHGLSRLPREECLDRQADGSILFYGAHFTMDGALSAAHMGGFVHLNEDAAKAETARRCGAPVRTAGEILTESTPVGGNRRNTLFNLEQVHTWISGWKSSPTHNAAMMRPDWDAIGVNVRNSDLSGTYIATVTFKR